MTNPVLLNNLLFDDETSPQFKVFLEDLQKHDAYHTLACLVQPDLTMREFKSKYLYDTLEEAIQTYPEPKPTTPGRLPLEEVRKAEEFINQLLLSQKSSDNACVYIRWVLNFVHMMSLKDAYIKNEVYRCVKADTPSTLTLNCPPIQQKRTLPFCQDVSSSTVLIHLASFDIDAHILTKTEGMFTNSNKRFVSKKHPPFYMVFPFLTTEQQIETFTLYRQWLLQRGKEHEVFPIAPILEFDLKTHAWVAAQRELTYRAFRAYMSDVAKNIQQLAHSFQKISWRHPDELINPISKIRGVSHSKLLPYEFGAARFDGLRATLFRKQFDGKKVCAFLMKHVNI